MSIEIEWDGVTVHCHYAAGADDEDFSIERVVIDNAEEAIGNYDSADPAVLLAKFSGGISREFLLEESRAQWRAECEPDMDAWSFTETGRH